jgi:hypothetical protein
VALGIGSIDYYKNWTFGHMFCPTPCLMYRSPHHKTNFLLLNSNVLVFAMVTVNEHAAQLLQVLQINIWDFLNSITNWAIKDVPL